jgi:two-component system, OmpR family, sensor histidine kinase CpxA
MKSLFLKIFLSFWMAQALFVALAMIAAIAFRPQTESPHWEYIRTHIASRVVDAYEAGGTAGLNRTVDEIEHGLRIHVFLVDANGQNLSGRPLPPWAEPLLRGAEARRSSWLDWFSPRRLVIQDVTGQSGQQFKMVMEVPPRPWPLLLREHPPGTGLALAVLTSGLACYFLARYLTGPVRRLRSATQKLSAGDLSARADEPPAHRKDEIAELVRDFNTMAGRLEDLVGAQSQLLNDISHELRSPLARLNVALGLARQRAGAEAQGVLERIELEATRLNELIGRLLTLARLEAGEDAMRRTAFSLDELVRDITKDAEFEAQDRSRRVHCEIDEEAVVWGSPSLLHSAIENVVRNAMRHTGEGTEVVVRVSRELVSGKDEAVIQVLDSGPGVPSSALDKLFRPFYRLDDARGRNTGGVGLGLAITERAVRLHGGAVHAANRPEGGLIVEIRLPLDTNLQPTAAVEVTEIPAGPVA